MGCLDRKSAVVTGGARGIGKQIALAFAREGADIVLADVLEMGEVALEIEAAGQNALTVKTDVSHKDEVVHLMHLAIRRFRKVDILVNNAGITRHAGLLEMREKDWDDVTNINLKGVFLCTQAVAKHMVLQRRGRIINMASIAATGYVSRGQANYGASKAGVIQLTRVSAVELGPYGINVNAIAPGAILTDLSRQQRSPDEYLRFVEEKKKMASLDRTGTPEDVANVALFLASKASSFISGQVIVVDGGRL